MLLQWVILVLRVLKIPMKDPPPSQYQGKSIEGPNAKSNS